MAARKKARDEWTATGSFVNKPHRGWLHPDNQLLPDAGVCYGVRVTIVNLLMLHHLGAKVTFRGRHKHLNTSCHVLDY